MQNLRENRVILLEIILCFHCHLKSFGGWAGHPGNSMTPKEPENYFSSLTAWRKKKKHNNPSEFPFSVLFGICGCLSLSTATLLMQTECCLRLVHFLFFSFLGCIILSLRVGCSTVLQRVLFSQWPYSILFYSMHTTVFVYLSMSLLLLWTRLNECPSFSVLP